MPSSQITVATPGSLTMSRSRRLGVPGHRPGLARDVEAQRELAAAQHGIARLDERERHRIADDALARRHGDALLALELDRPVGAAHDRAAAFLQADEDVIECHGLRAKGVRQTNAQLLAP